LLIRRNAPAAVECFNSSIDLKFHLRLEFGYAQDERSLEYALRSIPSGGFIKSVRHNALEVWTSSNTRSLVSNLAFVFKLIVQINFTIIDHKLSHGD